MIAEAILIFAALQQGSPELERFELPPVIQSVALGEAVEDAQELVDDVKKAQEPSLAWRMLGWGELLSCAAAAPTSISYRESRSLWESPYGNTFGTYATFSGIAVGSNYGTDTLRKKHVSRAAWASRVGTFAACTWVAGYMGNKGWKRE